MNLFRWDVVNELLSRTEQKRYLEIGIQRGVCGSKVKASRKVGVDPAPFDVAIRHYSSVCKQTSDAFFSELPRDELFDVVLVDGLHHDVQVLFDVQNALLHLADGGAIVMHDCNPQTEAAQRVPREVRVWNGDCWRAMVWLRQMDFLDAFTIDTDHGVGVVRKSGFTRLLSEVPEVLDYAALERDRARLLGLVAPDGWRERLAA
jgi:hypothetical protein